MRRTRMEETIIQAVSPLSGVGAAAASWAKAGSRLQSASATPPRAAARVERKVIRVTPRSGMKSEGVAVGLAGADANRPLERRDEDLAVADLAGSRGGRDRLHDAADEIGRDRDLDPHLGEEAHRVFGAAIDLGMALLATVTLH